MRLISAVCICAALVLAPAALAQTYKYDDKGRLIQADNSNGLRTTYSYDSADNRTSTVTATPTTNHAPVCSNFPILFNPPTTTVQTINVSASTFITACTDADGDTMTVTNPTPMPYSAAISLGQKLPVAFTVSDGKGGSGSATANICRPGNGVTCP